MNKAASVKARLMNIAEKEKRSYQELLQTYGLERAIYRLSISNFSDKFTLKGGIFLYALFDGQFTRATTDIDLLGNRITREKDELKTIFIEIFSTYVNDGLTFDTSTVQVTDIAEFKAHKGVRITCLSHIDRTRISITIDIGFGDEIVPARSRMDFPILLDDPRPVVFVYSMESAIAEKLEALVSLGFLNSRYKDFYDICLLSRSFIFLGTLLQKAIQETFANRQTSMEYIAAFEESFVLDTLHQSRWRSFVKKKGILMDVSFIETVTEIKRFTLPVLSAIRGQYMFDKIWDHETSSWN